MSDGAIIFVCLTVIVVAAFAFLSLLLWVLHKEEERTHGKN